MLINFIFIVLAIILFLIVMAIGYIASSFVVNFFLKQKQKVGRVVKNKLIFSVIYFVNLILIYQYQPTLMKVNNKITFSTYLWAWATVSVLYFLAPEIKKLFRGEVKPKPPERNFFTLIMNNLISIGVILAVVLISYVDIKIFFNWLNSIF